MDTHFLIPLRDRLWATLQEEGMSSLAQEDFCRLSRVNGHATEEKEVDCWRVRGANDLHPQQASVLNELCHYRDQMARSLNRPWFKVLNDQTLIDIACEMPQDHQALSKIPGMNEGQIRRHGVGLLEAVRRGQHAAPIYPPRSPRPNDAYLQRLDALRNWRKAAALKMGVTSDVILPRDLLTELAMTNPRRPEDLETILHDVPWRREHFGEQILEVLHHP
jgi:ribonuclease D